MNSRRSLQKTNSRCTPTSLAPGRGCQREVTRGPGDPLLGFSELDYIEGPETYCRLPTLTLLRSHGLPAASAENHSHVLLIQPDFPQATGLPGSFENNSFILLRSLVYHGIIYQNALIPG